MARARPPLTQEIAALRTALDAAEARAAELSAAHPEFGDELAKLRRRLERLMTPPAPPTAPPPGPAFPPHIDRVIDYLLDGLDPADVHGAALFAMGDIRRFLGVLLVQGVATPNQILVAETGIHHARLSKTCRYNVQRILRSRAGRSQPGDVEFELTFGRQVVNDLSQIVFELGYRLRVAAGEEEGDWVIVAIPEPIVPPTTYEDYFRERLNEATQYPDTPLAEQ